VFTNAASEIARLKGRNNAHFPPNKKGPISWVDTLLIFEIPLEAFESSGLYRPQKKEIILSFRAKRGISLGVDASIKKERFLASLGMT